LFWLFAATLLVTCLLLLLQAWTTKHRLRSIPPSWGVTTILYAEEEAWGIGPGGNESGLIVYQLPRKFSAQLTSIGPQFLATRTDAAQSTGGSKIRSSYNNWRETPIANEPWLCAIETCPEPGKLSINNYLGRYGHGISLPMQLSDEINQLIATPGTFYAQNAVGVLLVSSKNGRAYFVYSG
jgi:hypothetical protein